MDRARSTRDHTDPEDRPDAGDRAGPTSPATSGQHRWTPLAAELRRLRADAGDPSFQTIAGLVRERRLSTGASPAEARVARSTVYDCFRDGRTRMNLPLVREIALALGVPEDGVDGWVAAARAPLPDPAATGDVADPAPSEEAAPRTAADPPTGGPEPDAGPATSPAPDVEPDARLRALVVLGCVVLNLAGLWFVALTAVPFFLDMTGTAVAAITLGPWWGALVGVLSSVVGLGTTAPEELGFTAVNVAGALLWGYGVRRWGMGRTLPRFLVLDLGVGAVCTVLAVPVLLLVAGASPRGPQDQLTVTFAATLGTWVAGLVAANLVASLVDKTVTGFLALVGVSMLPGALRRGSGLVVADGGRRGRDDPPDAPGSPGSPGSPDEGVSPAAARPAGGP